ncbi:MAG: hypothetical protein ABJ314_13220, partial [Ilumatobacter sp.]
MKRTRGAVAALAVIAAGCTGSSGGEANGPTVSLGTIPSAGATTAPPPATEEVAATDSATTPPDPSVDGAAASTTVLTPSPDADLPTEATPSEPAPVTTIAGPL